MKDRKIKRIDVYVTDEQKRIIENGAQKAGVPISAWLLSLGLKAAKENK